jgi:hypothetical protein
MSFGGVKEVSGPLPSYSYQQDLAKKRAAAATKPAAPAPAASAPASTPFTASLAPSAPSSATLAGGRPAGAKVVEPESDSMAGLQAAMGMGGGEFGGGAGDNISGPSKFRQGIGQRIPPQLSASLAGLRQAY